MVTQDWQDRELEIRPRAKRCWRKPCSACHMSPLASGDHTGHPGELGRCPCAGLAGDAAELCLPGLALGPSSALRTPQRARVELWPPLEVAFPWVREGDLLTFLPPDIQPFLGHCPHASPNRQPRAALPYRFTLICPSTDVAPQNTRSNWGAGQIASLNSFIMK